MPLPDIVRPIDDFNVWFNATNNLISHVSNTSSFILVAQNATPQVSTGNISVSGTATLGTVAATNLTVTANAAIGNVVVQNRLTVNNDATFSNSIAVTQDVTVTGNVIGQNLTISQNTNTAVLNTNTLSVVGNVVVTGNLNVSSTTRVATLNATTITTTGNVVVGGTLNATGNVTTSGSMNAVNVFLTGNLVADRVSGNGIAITFINATNIGSGTISSDRLPLANSINAGAVSAGPLTQTFAGDKDFLGAVALRSTLIVNNEAIFDSTVNALSSLRVAGTINAEGLLTVAGNANFDSGVLFVDATNNRVGVNNASPAHALRVDGTTSLNGAVNTLSTLSVSGAVNALSTLGVSGAVNALSTLGVTGAANALSTLGVSGTLSALGQLSVAANAAFDTNVLFVDAIGNRVGVNRVPTAELDVNGTVNATAFTGSGAGLTALNATALSTGTVPLARLSSASSSANGVVDTTTQTFAGDKTFQNAASFSNTIAVAGNAAFDTNVLYVDVVNNRVGVNTSTPGVALEIMGAVRATEFIGTISTDPSGAIANSTLPYSKLLNNTAARVLMFNASQVATATDVTGDVTISSTGVTAIGTGKVTSAMILDGTIVNGDISASAGIAATKIGTGTVDNTEFGYLDGVTSAIQTQLNNKAVVNQQFFLGATPIRINAVSGETATLVGMTQIGINNTSPLSTHQLRIDGNASFSGTVNTGALQVTGLSEFLANVNFDNGTLFVDITENRVGVGGNTTPGHALRVQGTASINGAFTTDTTAKFTGAVNAFAALGVGGTLSALGELSVAANAAFDTNVLFVDTVADRIGVKRIPGSGTALDVNGTVNATAFTGSGAGITALNANELTTGTVPLARLSAASTSANGVVNIGTQTFAGDKTFQNTASFSNTVAIVGAVTASNTLGVTGVVTLSNTLGVTGAVTLSNTLGVTGAVTLSNTVSITGAITTANTIAVAANAAFDTNVLFVDTVADRIGVKRIPGSGIGTGTALALDVNGTVNAAAFTGSGAGITGLNGSAITDGTVSSLRLPQASTTDSGVMNVTSQTFAGDKTFRDVISFSNTTAAVATSFSGNVAFDTNVLFVDAFNNRLGVNTATPDAGYAMDIVGKVRATEFVGIISTDPSGAIGDNTFPYSKFRNNTAARILMFNASQVATATDMSGDVTISSTGVTTIGTGAVTSGKIANDTIVDADINGAAAISLSKLANITAGRLLMGNASSRPEALTMTGDITISDTGVTAISSGVITNADIATGAGIEISKLAARTISGVSLGGTLNALTFNTAGTGDAGGATYTGAEARTLSYNSIGAAAVNQQFYLGTTAININRGPSAPLNLSDVNLVNGRAAVATLADTAVKWTNQRGLTIGNARREVDGTADVTWELENIGAAANNQQFYIGTTAIRINRGGTEGAQTLTGVSIDGSANAATYALGTAVNTNFSLQRRPGAGPTAGGNLGIRRAKDNAEQWFFESIGDELSAIRIYEHRTYGIGEVTLHTGQTSWGSPSDERIKILTEPIVNSVSRLKTLRTSMGRYVMDPTTKQRPFLIAQDVEQVFPEIVYTSQSDYFKDTRSMSYSDVVPYLVAAIKELSDEIGTLRAQVTALSS